ncbi:neutral zinc metallopeptidase [Sinosporangium siamense]|uniref:Metalloprotease n=1 Tax=Sinosporangium siamense TaxID=1367973 RepID=A0A919RGD5_9ACTN|nr:neutral zinc metallopeptidase [Sinosporangium siamense]GII93373.1 hypothetical protein Ssi02_36040 [Sinosporangium siamense]
MPRHKRAALRRAASCAAALGLLAGAVIAMVLIGSAAAGGSHVAGHAGRHDPAVAERYGLPADLHGRLDRARVLNHNPLYALPRLDGFGCRASAIADGDAASMATFLGRFTDCLDRSWHAGFTRLGLAYTRPERVFWNRPGRGPCGDFPVAGASAIYCPINGGVYIGTRDIVKGSAGAPGAMYGVYARVLAHEYSHHVQDQAGILRFAWRLRDSSPTGAANEITRRVELQAQCLAGVYFGVTRHTFPMTGAQWAKVLADSRTRGEDRTPEQERDHGSGANYAGWLARGYTAAHPGVCDTWSVPASAVS